MSLLLTSLDDILAFIKDLHTHGISWGAILTALILWSKLKKNMQFKESNERLESKVDAIMQKVGAEWSGKENPSSNTVVKNLKQLLKSLMVIRRKYKMQNVNWVTLIPALFGAIKLILQPFGLDLSHIADSQVNDVANGIAALVTIVGILIPHKKNPAKTMGDSGSAV